ncbi:immunity repressor [Mycobacterium phage Florinda]|uniref:Immunity repressor n=2 Tax=Cheoctovirus TaxID=1623281 RepID=A0A0K1LRF7_9CAUD|nr:transcriptional repressor [Mycobacterium phage Florinda]AKU45024.1 immunity repressor [Mycobacterium phage Florinda]
MVANALGAPVLEAFLVAGYLKPGDTRKVVQVDRPLDQRSDEELVAEVNRRLKEARNVMETAQTTRTPRETHQDQEEALGARPGESPQPSQPRASETGPAIHAHVARSVRARQRRKD